MTPGTKRRKSSSRSGMSRKRPSSGQKLLVGSRVEIRSLEDGLLGSWNVGTVIGCKRRMREVHYDHCFVSEDSSSRLKEAIPVSVAVDGRALGDQSSNYRGIIRPVPPTVRVPPEKLRYGLCVDVHHEDAWWEGVIFDHSTDAKRRTILFPDMGDQLVIDVGTIRITQDWLESDDFWVHRGSWVFLDVLREYEEEIGLPVSKRQIWYDIQEKEGFNEIEEWTCQDKSLWEKLVLITVVDNLLISLSSTDTEASEIIEQVAAEKSSNGVGSPTHKVDQPQMNELTQLGSKESLTEPPPDSSASKAESD